MSMYLSKIILNVRHPSVRQALRDVNDMHRNLMAGFDTQLNPSTARADCMLLYRLFSRRDCVYLLVSSREKPDAKKLAERGFDLNESMIRDVSALREKLTAGRCLRFELLASPCKKVGGEAKNSRRVFLDDSEQRMAWLRRKGEQGGFELLWAEETGSRVDATGRRGDMRLQNSGVLFTGLLRITDAAAFWQSYTRGIGPGKAYGMGMLNLSRA